MGIIVGVSSFSRRLILSAIFGLLTITFFNHTVLALSEPEWWLNEYQTTNGATLLGQKQIDWCYANLNKKQNTEIASLSSGFMAQVINDCTDQGKIGPCFYESLDKNNPANGSQIICDRSRASDKYQDPVATAVSKAKINEAVQLVHLLCGEAQTDSQVQAQAQCVKAVRGAYYSNKCYYHNGRDSKDGPTSDEFAAQCVSQALAGKNIPGLQRASVAEIVRAISDGRSGAQREIDDAVKQSTNKAACEKDGKCQQKEDTSTCNIEGGMSWIICPVMNTLASINDTAFSALKNFLEIDAKVITNNDIKGAWEKFRDIANVAFIGAFLIVIYSQMTGTGISNYGIKKIIPRIVVAAVLINISFWVCAVMVDISNIVGSSIYNLLGDSINIGGGDSGHEGWNAVVGGLLTGGIVIALVAALIFAPTVLLAVAVVLIILIARQAFVILLIAMSPLAFTAYLLPNTEQWFKKWWKAFVAVLMVYPTVGLVFGASTLASRVLGTSDDKLMQVAALAIMGIPLFAVPALLKGAMSAAGSIGQKLAGLQDRANGRSRAKLKDRYNNSAFAMGRAARKQEKENWRKRQFARAISGADNSVLGTARRLTGRGGLAVTPGGRYARKSQLRNATNVADKIDEDDVRGAESVLDSKYSGDVGKMSDALRTAIKANDHVEARALQNQLLKSSRGREAFHSVLGDADVAKHLGSKEGETIHSLLKSNVRNNHNVKGQDAAIDAWAKRPSESLQTTRADASTWAGLDDVELAGQSVESLRQAQATGRLDTAKAKLVLDNDNVNGKFKPEVREAFDKASKGTLI